MNKKLFNFKKPYLIAEIGGNHEGNINYAKKLINLAAKSGVDCIKLQIYSEKSLVNKHLDQKRYDHFKRFSLKIEDYIYLAKFIKGKGLDFSASIWDPDLINIFKKYVSFYKIGSGDLTAFDIIDKIVKTNKKILLSTGLSSLEQISNTISFIKKYKLFNVRKKLILLHCTSLYPNDYKNVNLKAINQLKNKFNLEIGYSDHCLDDNAILLSVLNEIKYIEFHFTDNKKRKFRDHQLSLDKLDVKRLIRLGNLFNKLLGKYDKEVKLNSKNDKKILSKGVIFSRDLKKNHKIKITDLSFARPAKHFFANDVKKILGKKLKKSVKDGFLVKRTDLL